MARTGRRTAGNRTHPTTTQALDQAADEYHGPDEIVGILARSFDLSGSTSRLTIMEIIASECGACHLQGVTAKRVPAQLDCVEVLVHEISDGKILRTYHRPDSHAIDAFPRLSAPASEEANQIFPRRM